MEKAINDNDIKRFYEAQKAEVKILEERIENSINKNEREALWPLLTSVKSSVATLEYVFKTK